MPYDYNGNFIPSRADKTTDMLGFGEIGGIGQLIYHVFRYKDYELQYGSGGELLACPVCKPGFEPEIVERGDFTGKDIFTGLCNLAKKIDDFSEKKPHTELIVDWCKENAHPYSIDYIYSGLTDKNYDIETDSYLMVKDGVFSISEFMKDLSNLYNAAQFYSALEGVCLAEEDAAEQLYSEGKHFEGLPFFEKYKHAIEQPNIDYSTANGDLLKEMQLGTDYAKAHPSDVKYDDSFVREPYDYYEELRDKLIDLIPDFKMCLKVDPVTNRLAFSADIDSVFDISWYTLARLLSEDPAPEEKGKVDERPDSIMICCHHCGDFMFRRNSRQKYCKKTECQRARNANNQKNFRDRESIKKVQNDKRK